MIESVSEREREGESDRVIQREIKEGREERNKD